MGDLQQFIQTAAQQPRDQVSAGQIPLARRFLVVPHGQSQSDLHYKLLKMTNMLLAFAGSDLVKKGSYKNLQTADRVVEALSNVSDAVHDKFMKGFTQFLRVSNAPQVNISRKVPREDVLRELVSSLFEGVVYESTDTYARQELETNLKHFFDALATLPLPGFGENREMKVFFITSRVNRQNVGGPSNPFFIEDPVIKFHLVKIDSDVFRELFMEPDQKKKSPKPKTKPKQPQAQAQASSSLWSVLFGNASNVESDQDDSDSDDEYMVSLKAEYCIIDGKLNIDAFDRAQSFFDDWFKNAAGEDSKAYADRTTKILFV